MGWTKWSGFAGGRNCRLPAGAWRFIAGALFVAVAARAAAAGCEGQGQKRACSCKSGLMLCCPDDYCRKPMPCLPCPQKSCCPDDYCRKPMPCLPCPQKSCCPDDYCRKPMPSLCWPPLPVKYSCGPCPARKDCRP